VLLDLRKCLLVGSRLKVMLSCVLGGSNSEWMKGSIEMEMWPTFRMHENVTRVSLLERV
jgi:hypothetical protein